MYVFLFETAMVSIFGFLTFLNSSYLWNSYLRNFNNLFVSLILPVITVVITKSISSNLYLSLGMIGALSIVRYRTPIKSSMELALIFYLITLGISTIVKFEYALFLFLFVNFGQVFLFILIQKLNLFTTPLYEKNNFIQVTIETQIDYELDFSNFENSLVSQEISYLNNPSKIFIFKFEKEELYKKLMSKFNHNHEKIKNISVQKYN